MIKRLFISLVALVSLLTASAAGGSYKGYIYNISGDTAKIYYYTDSLRQAGGDLEVPGFIPHEGKLYHTVIGREAFKRCAWINNVTLQYGCLGVEMSGFGFCNNIVTFKVPTTVKFLESNYLSVDNSLGKTANVIYTGLEPSEDVERIFANTYKQQFFVATTPLQEKLKAKYKTPTSE